MTTTVIGIDPGSQRTGWGIVQETSGVLSLVASGIVQSGETKLPFSERLALIYHQLASVLGTYRPEEAAIEDVFIANNSRTALKLGQARGVAVACCAAHNIAVADYSPALVKKTLVGNGRAEKEQVAYMVCTFLNIPQKKWQADTSDALGIAICHLSLRAALSKMKSR